VRLVGGNENVTRRRLRGLWEWGYINRFVFPGIRTHSEFIYYLDRREAIELLTQHHRVSVAETRVLDDVRLNRHAAYAEAVISGQHMKLGFLRHALMVSRLHFMIERLAQQSSTNIEISSWRQGAELRGHKAELSELKCSRRPATNEYVWNEQEKTVNSPVEPDALFSLRFSKKAAQSQSVHFCYEADRGSMPMADMLKKFRAYYHFIKRSQAHRDAFGIHPIRAVLVETTGEARARKLMQLAEHPLVMGRSRRCALFWFVISSVFDRPVVQGERQVPIYLLHPELVFERVWALPDLTLHSLADIDNAA